MGGPTASKVLEIECGRSREEENALVNECGFRRVKLLDVAAGLKHVRDRSELEAQPVAGFDMLAGQILASRQDTVEAIGKKVHALGGVLMTLKHCGTPLATNAGERNATNATEHNDIKLFQVEKCNRGVEILCRSCGS
jgi:hypothetical protein